MTKRPSRIQATLTVGKVTIPVRSKLVAQRLLSDQEKIQALTKALVESDAECARLRDSNAALRHDATSLNARRWVKLGRRLGLMRVG